MKKNITLIVVIAILCAAAILIHLQNRKGRGNMLQDYFHFLFKNPKPATEKVYDRDVAEPLNNRQWLKQQLGYGDDFLNMFSTKDLAIVRDYVENWTHKGRFAKITDPIFKDLDRINSYANIFPDVIKTKAAVGKMTANASKLLNQFFKK